MIYIFDLDGTLADLSHRLPLIQGENRDWPAFYRACPGDSPIMDVIELLDYLSQQHMIVIISGRSDEVRDKTGEWLKKYDIPHSALYMRKAGDYRPDFIVKSELLDQMIQKYGEPGIMGVFEDRSQVVKMYRERGLRVYQVAEGEF